MRISRKKFRTFFEIFVSRPRYQCKNYCDKNMKQGCSETSNLSLYVCMYVCFFFLYFFRIPSYPLIPARANLVPRVLSLPRESRESTLGTRLCPSNLVPRVSLLCLPWSFPTTKGGREERPWERGWCPSGPPQHVTTSGLYY